MRKLQVIAEVASIIFFALIVGSYIFIEQATCAMQYYDQKLVISNNRLLLPEYETKAKETYFDWNETISPIAKIKKDSAGVAAKYVLYYFESIEGNFTLQEQAQDPITFTTHTIDRKLKEDFNYFNAVYFDNNTLPFKFYLNLDNQNRSKSMCAISNNVSYTLDIGKVYTPYIFYFQRLDSGIFIVNLSTNTIYIDCVDRCSVDVVNSSVTIYLLVGNEIDITFDNLSNVEIVEPPIENCVEFEGLMTENTCRLIFYAAVSPQYQESITMPYERVEYSLDLSESDFVP